MRRRIAALVVAGALTFGTAAVTATPVAAQETGTTQEEGGDNTGIYGLAGLLGLLGLAGLRGRKDDRDRGPGGGMGGGTRP